MLNEHAFPRSGRIAAVDYGSKRIGVAICDPDWILASPLVVYDSTTENVNAQFFMRLAEEERIMGWIVGLPIHCDGGESSKSLECRTFARWLTQTTGLPGRLFDERFTTSAARERMRTSGRKSGSSRHPVDAIAALILLESFLEASRYHETLAGHSVEGPANGAAPLDD
jgi:putative Holliday junction resolvase